VFASLLLAALPRHLVTLAETSAAAPDGWSTTEVLYVIGAVLVAAFGVHRW
jgi:hypothetical protein